MAKISVLCPSFNHQRFIVEHIQSVLNQSFKDFELVIVDDCSTDENVAEINKFKDPRIKLIRHEFNRGINASLNTAFENASGEYLMLLAGDDCLELNALEIIVEELDNTNAVVLYPSLMRIDINGKKVKPLSVEYKDRFEILNTIFMKKNCLYAPGMSMRKDIFARYLYPLDNSMCLHQDTQMHVKLLLNGEPKFLDQNLILYRFDDNVGNISKPFMSHFRAFMEIEKLMDTFLEIKDLDLLNKIFAKEIDKMQIKPSIKHLEFFLGNMGLLASEWHRMVWGYHKIMQAYDTKEKAYNLQQDYGFEFKNYLDLIQTLNMEHSEEMRCIKKYKKYKKCSILFACFSVILLVILIIGVSL